MKEIKFREWMPNEKCMFKYSLQDTGGSLFDEGIVIENGMQYTGLKDKNGKEWFEKDIIKHINKEAGYGDMNQHDYLYTVVPDIENLYGDDYLLFCMKSGENVGNEYENSELLS